MTIHSNFQVGNIEHACYFAVGARLLNFCSSFSNDRNFRN